MTALIADSAIFVTQLELALPTVQHGLALARSLNVPTILNPAPACKLPASIFPHCDFITPNETEAEILTGIQVRNLADAERAADAFLALGVRNAIITLGAQGAFVKNATTAAHIPAFNAGPVVETTGAGDAFNGGFAVALAEGQDILPPRASAAPSPASPSPAPAPPPPCPPPRNRRPAAPMIRYQGVKRASYFRAWIVVALRRARFAAISRISRPSDVRFITACCTMPIRLPTDQ